MKTAVVFIVLTCVAVSALSLDAKKSKPSATVTPAQAFSPTPTPSVTPAHNTTTPAPTTTTIAHNTTTPAPNTTTPAHNTTTISPNTTTPAHNTTTPAHNTTTISPNTTTVAPNTTTPAHNTTTISPNTTTTAPNTTTTAPTPTPPTSLTVGNYSLTKDNKVCLMAQMALQIRIDKANSAFNVQPNNTKAGGGCNISTANLTLSFKEGFITFMFNKSSDDTVYVNELSLSISYNFNGANTQYKATNASLRLFTAKVGHSYSCKKESVFMGNGLYLDVSQDQMQAFNLTNDKDFGSPEPCAADKLDYSVAIGVGVALLVLIVIVVVVYLVSRKKRTDGYQSL